MSLKMMLLREFILIVSRLNGVLILYYRYKNDEIRRGCILQWPDGDTSASHQEHM